MPFLIQACSDKSDYILELENQVKILQDSIEVLNEGSHFEKIRPSFFLDSVDEKYYKYSAVIIADGFYHKNSIFYFEPIIKDSLQVGTQTDESSQIKKILVPKEYKDDTLEVRFDFTSDKGTAISMPYELIVGNSD